MLVHVLILLYICILGLLVYNNAAASRKRNSQFVFLAFIPVFLVQSLRGSTVGWDTWSYIRGFNYYRQGLKWRSWEPLFRFLIRRVASVTSNVQWFFALCSLLILLGIGVFIVFNTPEGKSAFWPVFLFMVLNQYFSTMNLLRQSMAMAIGINVYTILKFKRGIREYIVCALMIVLSMQLHTSSAICLALFLPFFIKKMNRRIILSAGVLSVAGVVGFSWLLTLFFRVFPRYEHYLSSKYWDSEHLGMSGYYWMVTAVKIVILVLVFLLNPNSEKNTECYRLSYIAVLSIGITLLQMQTALAIRVGYYLEIFIILLIPGIISRFRNVKHSRTLIWGALLIGGWAYFIYAQSAGSVRGCVPYLFYWQYQ